MILLEEKVRKNKEVLITKKFIFEKTFFIINISVRFKICANEVSTCQYYSRDFLTIGMVLEDKLIKET